MTMYDHYLITGATGFLGKTLTERLIKSGARVTALVLADDPLLPCRLFSIPYRNRVVPV